MTTSRKAVLKYQEKNIKMKKVNFNINTNKDILEEIDLDNINFQGYMLDLIRSDIELEKKYKKFIK